MNFVAGRFNELSAKFRWRLARYRYQVFIEHLGWELETPPDMDVDQFDHERAHYVVVERADGSIQGCARLLPTTQPYLLGEVFSPLLDGHAAPSRPDVWELSRFATFDPDNPAAAQSRAGEDFAIGFLRKVMAYAQTFGVRELVSVSPVGVGRLLRRGGIRFELLAPPRVLENRALAACRIPIQ